MPSSAISDRAQVRAPEDGYFVTGLVLRETGLTAPSAPEKVVRRFETRLTRSFAVGGWPGGLLVMEIDPKGGHSSPLPPRFDTIGLPMADGVVTAVMVKREQQVLRWRRNETALGVVELGATDPLFLESLALPEPLALLSKRNWLEPGSALGSLVSSSQLTAREDLVEERSGFPCTYWKFDGPFGALELWTSRQDPNGELVRMRVSKGRTDPFGGAPVSQFRGVLHRFLPEAICDEITYEVGLTDWWVLDGTAYPTKGYSRLEFRYNGGDVVEWTTGKFTVDELRGDGPSQLADTLVAEIPNGAIVRRVSQATGGVIHEWHDGEVIASIDPTAMTHVEAAVADAQGLTRDTSFKWLMIGVVGALIVLTVIAVAVALRVRRGRRPIGR